MNPEEIKQIQEDIKVPLGAPEFYTRVFTYFSKRKKGHKKKSIIEQICKEEYDGLSRHLDETQIQDSCLVRNNLRTRRLAMALLNGKGELQLDLLEQAIQCFKENLYSLGPQRHHDAVRQEHIVRVLRLLLQSKELRILLKTISKPYFNRLAEGIIRDTLQLSSSIPIEDSHARMAALAAWLCYLRQSVGSCFATAPAIIVHDTQPERFLIDIRDLLGTGKIKRTYAGMEYTAPLSASWGAGDLKRPLLVTHPISDTTLPIWKSPGLIVALVSSGLIDEKLTLIQKINHTKDLISRLFLFDGKNDPYFFINAEEILRRAILDFLKITENDLKEYENRPRGMIHSGLMMQAPLASGSLAGIGKACSIFYEKFDNAKKAFKSIADNALLKAWEFTVASFAEVKANFAKWNLYSSLGMGPQEPGGIGHALFDVIKRKLEQANEVVRDFQSQCEQILGHVKHLESRMRNASQEKELHWLKIEWQNRAGELHHYQELRDDAHAKAERLSGVFDVLIELYIEQFPLYFQEVYDAEMVDVALGPYDDSPAGFRLIYKAGRAASSSWSTITNVNQFVDALVNFFVMTETELIRSPQLEGLEQEVGEMVTAIVSHIRTTEFIETAFDRMAIAHHTRPVANPLENLDKVEKKPWVYTSGGTMNTLVSNYFSREEYPTEVARWVENESELLDFFIGTIKQMPPKISAPFCESPELSLLSHSPTHAYLVKPCFNLFKKGWTDDNYTYTWIKEDYVLPRQRFIDDIQLDRSMMQMLAKELQKKLPRGPQQHLFHKAFSHFPHMMTCSEFREHIIDTIATERGLRWGDLWLIGSEEVDSLLYNLIPLFPSYKIRERIENVFKEIKEIKADSRVRLMKLYEEFSQVNDAQEVHSAKTLRETCLALLMIEKKSTTNSFEYQREVSQAMQNLGYSMPQPIIFADTNWVRDYFGFVVNPGTSRLEFWRLDALGITGAPMHAWKPWLNGTRKDRTWGVYTHPYEYR